MSRSRDAPFTWRWCRKKSVIQRLQAQHGREITRQSINDRPTVRNGRQKRSSLSHAMQIAGCKLHGAISQSPFDLQSFRHKIDRHRGCSKPASIYPGTVSSCQLVLTAEHIRLKLIMISAFCSDLWPTTAAARADVGIVRS